MSWGISMSPDGVMKVANDLREEADGAQSRISKLYTSAAPAAGFSPGIQVGSKNAPFCQ